MRDPRTLGPYLPQRLPSPMDIGGASPALAMTQAAEPPPSVASRIVGMVGGGVGALASLPFLIPQAAAARLQQRIDEGRSAPQARMLELERARLQNEEMMRQAQLEQAQLPAQQAAAVAQTRQLSELDQRIRSAPAGRERDSLIRGAATGTFRPFDIEPGPAELAAYQMVLGMQEETVRQKLIGQREQQQADHAAILQRETNRLDNVGKYAIAELGKLPGVEDEKAMRTEFEGLSKEFSTVRQAYKTLNSVSDTKAGDLTLLVQFMKLIDPGASVREGDLATAENAGGVPAAIRAVYNKFRSDEGRIDPALRQDYLAQAENLYQSRLGSHRGLEKQYGEIALRRGIDPRNVITDFVGPDPERKDPAAGKPKTVRQNGQTYTLNPKTGEYE